MCAAESYYWESFNHVRIFKSLEISSIDRDSQIRSLAAATRVVPLSDKRRRRRVVERLVVARRNREAGNDSGWNPRWQTV